MQKKVFAIKNQKNIMTIKNNILLLQNLIKKALQALWFLTVQELRKLICSFPSNRAMRRSFYVRIKQLCMAPRSF